jgi:hypothetical protein
MSGKITMECVRCGFMTNGYKRGRLKKRLENHLLKCPIVTLGVDKPKTKTAEAMMIDVNVGEGERLAQSDSKATEFDAAMKCPIVTLGVEKTKTKTAEAMVIDVNVGDWERLAESESKATEFDAAMRRSLDYIAETDNILEKTAKLPEDAAEYATNHENVEADTAKTLKTKMTIGEQGQFVEVCDSDMTYKFLTGSGTWQLYKYLRYESLTNVGAVTEVAVYDTGGTMKTADNLDVSSKPDVPNKSEAFSKPDVTSNVESLCPRKIRLECKRQHFTKPPDQPVPVNPTAANGVVLQDHRSCHRITGPVIAAVRQPEDPPDKLPVPAKT